MYDGLSALVRGWGKNMYAGGRFGMRGGDVGRMLYPILLPLVPLGMLAPFVGLLVAVAMTVNGATPWALLTWSVTAGSGVLATFASANRLNGDPRRRSLLAPLGAIVLLYICVTAVLRGHRVEWKGRDYHAA